MMTQSEKEHLVALFSVPSNWCQESEARDRDGESVNYNDPEAVAWDLTGGICHLFGWDRAQELFPQIERHVVGRKPPRQEANPAIASMIALQDFNDSYDTTYDTMLGRLNTIPVTIGSTRESAAT